MKVLAIQGSPHRGNTWDRVEQFGRLLENLGDVEFEHVALNDVNLEMCRGCYLCFDRGEENCPIQDDRSLLEQKLAEADGVVFASPVYAMNVTAMMKNFVDRLAYTFHRPRYFGKYAVGISVAGGIGNKETLGYIRMYSSEWGFGYVDGLGYLDPPKNSSIPRWPGKRDRTSAVAERFHHLMKTNPLAKPSLKDLFGFHVMRAVYSRMEQYCQTDYSWWKGHGWLEPGVRYYTPASGVGILKSLLPRFAALMIGRKLDRSDRPD